MCEQCGCSTDGSGSGAAGAAAHQFAHDHGRPHVHAAPAAETGAVRLVLTENDRLAERNRGFFQAKKLCVLNLLSAPGAGKTALLERTIRDLPQRRFGVITGDLQTDNDARRIRAAGAPAVQVTTGSACHLDAHLVRHALEQLDLDALDLLFIENVGNLVCPALFDLGEEARVVLCAVTEGEDKPLKYPAVFQPADLVLLTKQDLAEAAEFRREAALANLRAVAPRARVLELSAQSGAGLDAWYRYLEQRMHAWRGGAHEAQLQTEQPALHHGSL
ncbi:MAG: hydrogenase nickel incorporation protein HypB [Kiritimatiellaeota bacterium]|nr:hydrogenase nickel incorporation protein HypB [Kiritimatiellota bacterium]